MFLVDQIFNILECFERSCDTEHWRNACSKFGFAITGVNYILKHIELENHYFDYYFHNITIYYILNKQEQPWDFF